MKKRKELDALLTMANGKKNGKSKRSKEGHELLRLDSDSNSSDNDELFLTPKKTVIRRPRQCQCCAMCVPLIMFLLTMGCMVVTGGLIWMHFNLKQDLDDLRIQLQNVEKKATSASSQQNTILDLDERLQRMNDIPEKVDTTALKVMTVNQSMYASNKNHEDLISELKGQIEVLEARTSSTSTNSLQKTVADLGSEVEGLKRQQDDQEKRITSEGVTMNQLTTDVNSLKSQVAVLQQPSPTQPATPAPPLPLPTTKSATPAAADAGSPINSGGDGGQIISLREEIGKIWGAIDKVNVTVETLSSEHNDLVSRVTVIQQTLAQGAVALPTSTASLNATSPQSIQAGQFDLAQMKADIELLKEEYNRSIASIPMLGTPPQDSASMNDTWMQLHVLTDRIQTLEERMDANKINVTVMDSLQFLLERSLTDFKEKNLADVTDLTKNVSSLQGEMKRVTTFQDEVGTRMMGMGDQIGELRLECSACQGSSLIPIPTSSSGASSPPDAASASPMEIISQDSTNQGSTDGITEPPSP